MENKLIITSEESLRQIMKELIQEQLLDKISASDEKFQYFGIEKAADILGMSKAAVYQKCSSGEIQYYKSGKRSVFKLSDLTNYIEKNKK